MLHNLLLLVGTYSGSISYPGSCEFGPDEVVMIRLDLSSINGTQEISKLNLKNKINYA